MLGRGLRQAQPERKLLKLRQVPFALSLSKGGPGAEVAQGFDKLSPNGT
jgi:hypothetical protein